MNLISKLKKQAYRQGFSAGKNNLPLDETITESEFLHEYRKGVKDGIAMRETEAAIQEHMAKRKPKFRFDEGKK